MFNVLEKNHQLFENQMRSKLLIKNLSDLNTPKSITLSTNLYRLSTFDDPVILETLYALELLTNLKPCVKFYRKMYQEVNLQLSVVLRNNNLFYFLYLLKVFYFPILKRRNETLSSSIDKFGNYSISLKNINLLPLFPDIYYKWNYTINVFVSSEKNNLLLSYLSLKSWLFQI